ncbi:complex I subunit 1 family protein [Anaerobaca lacustris]|uniref:NADH-quinone oxidoreductase subunit H n=1 Tax=Anaerobaca lacustris TaxID=3044600 RepID=A0AAW6U0X1_9BACT|nr:NADH-quinone oxidoreductase subunit H [Sedimentisphaerales bacterium M17dextr]
MTVVLQNAFWILIFPGLAFTLAVGLFASWLVRKVGALVQYRVGPPVYQPLADVMKLMGKEILVPQEGHRTVFIAAPLVGLAGVLLLSTILWLATAGISYVGDVIVAMYLMVFPSLALILGSSASGSPHAAVGAGREMKLVLGYELPLVLALIVVLIKTAGWTEPGEQLSLVAISQRASVLSVSGALAFIVALLCVQAKLGFVPFDIAESESELSGGVLIEYSGALLAVWKLMQAMMLVALPLFLVVVFLGGIDPSGLSFVWGIGKFVLVLVLVILIKNTNPRVRIDQAMRFFWLYCGLAMVVAVILASIGHYRGIAWL